MLDKVNGRRLVADDGEAARRKIEFQATILDNVQESIIVTDPSGVIIEWNRGAERVFGYSAAEMVGHTPASLYLDGGDVAGDLSKIDEGTPYVGEWRGRRKDGSIVWVEIRTTKMFDADRRLVGYLGVGKDISDRKSAERERDRADHERVRALEAAEEASQAKDEFLAMLGHELRNPLSPILTAVELMKLKGEGTTARELAIIERQVDHLVRLVDDLLDISRITRGKVVLKKANVDLEQVVVRAVEIASPLLEQRRHHLEVSLVPEGLRLFADGARITQIISNLLTNAARYTDPGGTIALRAHREEGEVVILVEDSGIGMSAEFVPRVFDLFVQGRRSADRAEGGLGIGLTLVHNLVRMHGGQVTAKSEGLGKGSQFTVRLPLLGLDEPLPASVRTLRRVTSARSPRRILVVDDNGDAADLLAEVLRLAGHEVTIAHDGPSALIAAQRMAPALAILDIGLPVMDGYELARKLRDGLGEGAPRLIAMTGYGQELDRRRSADAGFSDHLVKPVSFDLLLDRIDAG